MQYATEQDLQRAKFKWSPKDEKRHFDLLEAAARIIDLACGVPEGYFGVADKTTSKKIRSNGTRRLRMPPNVKGSIKYVGYSDSSSLSPDYIEVEDVNGTQWLVALNGEVWLDDDYVEIEAKFGFDQVPNEIVEATIQVAITLFNEGDAAYSRVVTDVNGGSTLIRSQALPPNAKLICDKWRRRMPAVIA